MTITEISVILNSAPLNSQFAKQIEFSWTRKVKNVPGIPQNIGQNFLFIFGHVHCEMEIRSSFDA